MAKISPVSIKYMIYASFKAQGPLEKPDVIGALFGQTEGLLGADLEMRELQKEGRIGRIEVSLEIVDGKSVGEIQIPTAMDKSETTLVAAALETIDRIGPTEAQIEITKIEDVRGSKRDYILERAKKLLSGIDSPDSFKEMSASLKEDSRAERIQEYGESKLSCGDISGPEIVVVEGRADVVNLLRNRVNNVIGMDGAKLPPEIIELSKTKELTIFVDGDRGGNLIANNLIQHAKVKYIAVAPDGKEVEELSGKDILISLRRRVPIEEYLAREKRFGSFTNSGSSSYSSSSSGSSYSSSSSSQESSASAPKAQEEIQYKGDVKEKLRESYKKIIGSKAALLLDKNLDAIRKVAPREIARNVKDSRTKVFAVILEGTATSSLISLCEDLNIPFLAATNFSTTTSSSKVTLVSL